MAARQLSTKSVDGICDLCCRESNGWAIGPCEHPVCYLCATKMRVLCENNECAVCRSEMDKVVFATAVRPFKSYKLISMSCDQKHAVYFQDDGLMQSYHDVQRFLCQNCSMEFGSMRKLNSHTRKEHNLHYCQICMEHLKLFPYERKMYSHHDLVRHNRQGDPDDTSHKGHPMCRFCNLRYFDKDQLHFHLHKNHFWCHFCEADGKQDYYVDYKELKKHFKSQHYLCEQDECAHKEIEAAFKTKIDFQAHVLNTHGQKMSKSQNKQKKQIDQVQLGFRYDRTSGNKENDDHDALVDHKGVDRKLPISHRKREDSEMTRAIALSLAEGDKSSNKTSKKNDSTDSQKPPPKSAVAVADPPPDLKKKKQSGNPNESQDSKTVTPAPDPPPGFKKKQSNNYEADFPVTIKPLESFPSVPSLPYGNLIGTNDVNVESFPTLSTVPTTDDKKVAPPPGFEKKMPSAVVVKPEPEKESFVKRLKHVLGSDEKFEQFKMWSSKYRNSEINAEEYESNCYKLFGDQQWNDIFNELVATLPDEQGQDNLIKAHRNRVTQATKKSKAKKHNYRPLTAWGPGNMVGNRMDDDLYPPLSGTASVQPPPAKWGHKVAVK